jgi:hypothetical protein
MARERPRRVDGSLHVALEHGPPRGQGLPARALAEVELDLVEPGRAVVGGADGLAAERIPEGGDGRAAQAERGDERAAQVGSHGRRVLERLRGVGDEPAPRHAPPHEGGWV